MEKEYIQKLVEEGVLQEHPDIQLLNEELSKLTEKNFISELSNQFYEFENNITWEVVYETLLFSERRYIHALIASHIEKNNSDSLEDVSDILSYHYEHAGDDVNFIKYTAMSGDHAAKLFANDDAINNYKKALDAVLKIDVKNAGDVSVLQEKKGDIYEASGKYSKAVEAYQRSFDIWSNGSNFKRSISYLPWKIRPGVRESQLCQKIGSASEHDGKYDDAISWLEKADALLPKRYGNVAAQIKATRCAVLFRKGEYRSAIDAGKESISLAKKQKDRRSTAYAYRVLAPNYIFCGDLSNAILILKKSARIYDDLEDYTGIASVSNNLGNILLRQARLEEAIGYLNTALESYKKIQNEFGITMTYFNLGNVLHDKGELVKAEKNMEEVIHALEEGICPPDMAGAAWCMRAQCAIDNGNISHAFDCINKGLELIEKTGQVGLLYPAKLLLAEIMILLGDHQQVYSEIESIKNKLEDEGITNFNGDIYRLIGSVKARMGYTDEAITFYEKSVNLYHETDQIIKEAQAIFDMVSTLIKLNYDREDIKKDFDLKKNIERALFIYKSVGNDLFYQRSQELQKKLN